MSEDKQRQFDWGPPAGAGDSLKEWLIYLVIMALLGVGVWILLDINGNKNQAAAVRPATSPAMPSVPVSTSSGSIAVPAKTAASAPARKFYVQLGAFADEASAREVFDQLTADGFSPTLAAPDDQYEIHRVLLGPFAGEFEAEEKAGQLNALGIHCFVSESP